MLRTNALIAGFVTAALAAGGCVERQMTLVTEPSGARAYYNEKYVGETPVTFHFTYYQGPGLRFEKDGYDTLKTIPNVKAPFYQVFPLDLFAETSPLTFYDRQKFAYTLTATAKPDIKALVERADELQGRTAPKK
jgi:hypothetical protein